MIDFARYSFSSTDRIPGEEPLPYVSAKRKFTFFWIIVLVHIALVVLPSIFMSVMNHINPPRYVMRVPIVESLPNDNPEMSPHPSPNRKKSTGTPDYGKPQQLSKIPDMPELLPEPVPESPQPEVQPKPQKAAPIKVYGKREVKLVEKKTSNRKIKISTKRVKVNTTPKIKISTKRVKIETPPETNETIKIRERRWHGGIKVYRGGSRPNIGKRSQHTISETSYTGTKGGQGTPGGGGGPKGILTTNAVKAYHEKIKDYVFRRWNQPTKAALNNTEPTVIIRITIDDSGRIKSCRILNRSGNIAMDRSVQELIENLRALPVPPSGYLSREIDVTMEIDR